MITRCYLEITNICNLDCVFCPKTERKLGKMTSVQYDAILKKISGEVKFLYFHLMGEPLLHPLLPEFIEKAKGKGFVPVLTTNGTLLEKAGHIIDALPHKVQISLHSHEGNGKENPEKYMHDVMTFSKKAAEKGIIIVLRLWNQGDMIVAMKRFYALLLNIFHNLGQKDMTDGSLLRTFISNTIICLNGLTEKRKSIGKRRSSAML